MENEVFSGVFKREAKSIGKGSVRVRLPNCWCNKGIREKYEVNICQDDLVIMKRTKAFQEAKPSDESDSVSIITVDKQFRVALPVVQSQVLNPDVLKDVLLVGIGESFLIGEFSLIQEKLKAMNHEKDQVLTIADFR